MANIVEIIVEALRNSRSKINNNFQAINNQLENHINGESDKHTAEDIEYSGSFAGKTNVKAALDQAKAEINTIVINASIDPEVAFARESITKGKTFDTLGDRLEEIEQDHKSHEEDDTAHGIGAHKADDTAHGIGAHKAEKATINTIGHIKPDGTSISVDGNGTISTTVETVDRTITVGVGKDFTSIQAAINSIKKRVDAIIDINVDAGTYAEDININGYIGSGTIRLNGGTDLTTAANYIVNKIWVRNNTCRVIVKGFTANTTTDIAFFYGACAWSKFEYCRTVVSATSQIGFYVGASKVEISNCLASNRSNALYVSQMSTVSSMNWTPGTGNTTGLYCVDASTIGKSGTQPQGTAAEATTGGGEIR